MLYPHEVIGVDLELMNPEVNPERRLGYAMESRVTPSPNSGLVNLLA